MTAELQVDDHELLARAAHRYYVTGRTQGEIAQELGLSRPKVQRLLDRARATGVVEIHISSPGHLRLDLERRLINAFGLADAVVCPLAPTLDAQRAAVARQGARYLERRLANHDGAVVAVSHGRTCGVVPRFFQPAARLDCTFVAAMGGSSLVDAPTNPNDICRSLADAGGGRAESLYAPVYVDDAVTRDALLAQDTVRRTLATAASADLALVGIGGTDDDCTMVRSGCLSIAEVAALRARGAVGDLLGTYVDQAGAEVDGPHAERVIALPIDDLRGVETVIAVVSESDKTAAILGALRSGVIDVLVVDEGNADRLLAGPGEGEV